MFSKRETDFFDMLYRTNDKLNYLAYLSEIDALEYQYSVRNSTKSNTIKIQILFCCFSKHKLFPNDCHIKKQKQQKKNNEKEEMNTDKMYNKKNQKTCIPHSNN